MSTLAIKEALAEKGIEAVAVEIVKNGVVCTGFQICTGSHVAPVVYYSQEDTVDAFVERVVRLKDQPIPGIDPAELVSRERLIRETYVCVQKKSKEDLVKRNFLNLEAYIRLNVDLPNRDTKGSVKITSNILERSGLTEKELFEAATANSLKKAITCSMAEALGMPEDMMMTGEAPFYVGTYEDKCHGAAVLMLTEVLHSFCKKHGYKSIYILPSSTEEVLLLPMNDEDPVGFAAMVHEINCSEVDPVLWLEPVVYIFDDEIKKVSIASVYGEEV